MAEGKPDNTAVNQLIDLAQQRPLAVDDALFAPPRRPTLPPPFPPRAAGTVPPPPAASATRAASAPPVPSRAGTMPPPLPRHRAPASTRTDLVATAAVVPAARVPVSEHDAPTRPFDRIDAEDVDLEPEIGGGGDGAKDAVPEAQNDRTIDRTPSVEAAFWAGGDASVDVEVEDDGRGRVELAAPARRRSARHYAPVAEGRRSWMMVAAAFALGMGLTAVIAWPRGGERGARPTAAPAPGPTVVAAPAPAPAPAPVPAPAAPVPVPEPTVAAAPAPGPVAPAPTTRPARSERRTARATPPAAPRTPAVPTGSAMLALGSKPPCEIYLDGKRTGLSTPNRGIKIAAGVHRVRLVNRQHKIDETFTVTAGSGKVVKVIKDYSAKLRR
jgi:hypothetical protein